MAKHEIEEANAEEEEELPKPKRISNDDIYRHSSQYRVWSFSREELEIRRKEINETGRTTALKKAAAACADAGKSPLEVDLVSVEEENKIISHYARRAHDIANVFKMPSQARATAISYFRKFFLVHSVMEYHPKYILYTCIFLAAKTENFFIKLSSFLKIIPKTTPEDILDLEYKIIQSLSFTLLVHHPFRPLYGFYIDIQNYLDLDNDKFYKAYERAKTIINESLISDAGFLFTPPQIALAAFYTADNKIIEKYLSRKFLPKEPETPVQTLETIKEEDSISVKTEIQESAEVKEEPRDVKMEEVETPIEDLALEKEKGPSLYEELMDSVIRCSEAFKTVVNPSREESTEIDKKVFFCINPDRLLKKREQT